ncbi:hypothetical protein [Methylibium sp.]|uniref:hypothetical protein n=1 Tax=Methylibium sp. TaxID=2067992 RepID=UPI003D0B7D77
MDVTAVILTPTPEARTPRTPGMERVVRVVNTSDMAELLQERLAAAAAVKTAWWFYLDADDDLPLSAPSVIAQGIELADSHGVDIAYTDEMIRMPGGYRVRAPGPYDRQRHLRAPMMLHHLVLARTAASIAAMRRLPRGRYWTEMLLFCEMAARGAAYVPRVGYIWNKGNGLHTRPATTISQMRSALWHQGKL